ncbi:unnamed protein product [Lymnaea stagnalis]|uniref:GH18 domain-containing protein n=1 Tax=Lymnaea stagnalis TaxID=6523 RepID=A0AAV2I1R1_LYMST
MTNWAQYRPKPMKFFPEDVDPDLCTHLIYAFASLEENKLVAVEWNEDETKSRKGLYKRVNRLRNKKPALKVLLSVGGWEFMSEPFSQMVSTAESRAVFVNTTVDFLRKRTFDGLDLHWEYPALRGGIPEDRPRFTLLVKELADAFRAETLSTKTEKLLLTAAVGASKKIIDTAYEPFEIERELDFINVMTYNFHGAWDTEVGHHSPLYAEDGLSLSFAADYLKSMGVPASKLVIGVGTYGRHVILNSTTEHKIGTGVKKAGKRGNFTRDDGALAYFEICKVLRDEGLIIREPKQHVPYYYKNRLWLGYDDAESLQEKVRYIKENHYGGVMIWTLDMDDFNGLQCEEGTYPLVKAIIEECKKF